MRLCILSGFAAGMIVFLACAMWQQVSPIDSRNYAAGLALHEQLLRTPRGQTPRLSDNPLLQLSPDFSPDVSPDVSPESSPHATAVMVNATTVAANEIVRRKLKPPKSGRRLPPGTPQASPSDSSENARHACRS